MGYWIRQDPNNLELTYYSPILNNNQHLGQTDPVMLIIKIRRKKGNPTYPVNQLFLMMQRIMINGL